ncbi:HEAT repeat domain-containing protein [Aquisphaera insulae]|uniref:HEAT repeat domain-containing protein n=1 Tax=Aquisphaera insulae TaxID=2712864 RepID=UPI0013EDB084
MDPSISPVIARAVHDRFDPVRREAALATAIEMKERGLPIVVAELNSEDPVMREDAASALQSMAEVAAPALPALRSASQDPDPSVRETAENTIKAIETALRKEPSGEGESDQGSAKPQ